ncbi:MFS transporter [Niastella yeongjuensis]|uniref:MFS transporter n=1 Tax=Niastella yeongjuensis TaxID=354355 RepID=A0A1V9EL55_9BACT|nr:MFS transporter [Niastella yeongjuensis]OQP46869.1 MFS transporter [Niastella yeongjuensis]SEN57967.1 MFS transporter, ACS family, hexuronate transporter [Niastella yeongjuensis]
MPAIEQPTRSWFDVRRRWFIVGIIFLTIVFNYVDRQMVSILKPLLKKEFALDDSGYAVIVNLFTICYAIMYPVSGWLVDKFGAGKIMLYSIVLWSIACVGGGLSRTVAQFGFFRGMLGLAEPANFPAQLKTVTVWFSGKVRATANSLCVAGSSIGAIIAPPLIAWLTLSFSWKTAFVVCGGMGLLIALLWKMIYRKPPVEVTKEVMQSENRDATGRFSWKQLWSTKSLWGILMIRFISDPVWYFCLFWLPGYLQEGSGLTLPQIGLFGWIPFLIADAGSIGTSAWSDKLVRRGIQPLRARKIMLTATVILAPLCALINYLPGAVSTLVVFSLIAVMALSWLVSLSVVVAESFPMHNVASVLGIAGGFGALGAVLFNYYVGQVIGRLGAGNIFMLMAILHPLSALILWTMVRKEKAPFSATAQSTN